MMHSLLQSMRSVENRHCSECTSQIGDTSSAFGILDFKVWACKECANAFIESSVLSSARNVKGCTEEWSIKEVNDMLSSHSNKAVNEVYERHVPPQWKKIAPKATRNERINWIKAKYKAKLFVFNQRLDSSISPAVSTNSSVRPSMDSCPEATELPLRLLDYFVVVTPGEIAHPTDADQTPSNTVPEQIEFVPTVASCFPQRGSLPDTPLPEHLGKFIYPNGVTLSSREIPPTFFTFVLTDTSGVKLYGGVLHVHEMVVPSEAFDIPCLECLTNKYVYVPKALVILSHYPFFHLFFNLLKQIYRVSLSSCPLSIERYIAYVIQEVPLPPHGCTRVVFSLEDRILTVSRPPRNQLPMIDFSYRPLFTLLSVKNILTVFSFICSEHKVCFASKYLSVLTPVQESFLSFLFPLVWQGAYIPVMPVSMLDLLDAPVPMMLGVERHHILDDKKVKKGFGEGVVIVDLDLDNIHVGCDEYGKPLEHISMPSKDLGKLSAKLSEFGGCIHRGPGYIARLEELQKAFPDNEHLKPIQDFSSFSDGFIIPFEKNVFDVKSISVQSSNILSSARSKSLRTSMLSPESNQNDGDPFNSEEIRNAFLRFFVSSLRDMHSDNIRQENKAAKKSKKEAPEMSKFLQELTHTQMLAFFSEERIYHPDHSEVKFFDESIFEKLNRSVTTVNKLTTPFLDDTSENIYEWHICLPCRAEKQEKHVYSRFPTLDATLKFPKKAKPLQREIEHRRKLDATNHMQAVDLALSSSQERHQRRSSLSFAPRDVHATMDQIFEDGEVIYHSMLESLCKIQSQCKSYLARNRFLKKKKSAIVVQRLFRRRTRRTWRGPSRKAIELQRILRGYLCRIKYKQLLRRQAAAVKVSSFLRMATSKIHYRKLLIGVIFLQALARRRLAQKRFKNIMKSFSMLKAHMSGHKVFIQMKSQRHAAIKALRKLIFHLWIQSETSLEYRSRFWCFIGVDSFHHLAFHIDEMKRLWKVLGYDIAKLQPILKYPGVFTSLSSVDRYVEEKCKGVTEGKALVAERKRLYTIMKSGEKGVQDQARYFERFGIASKKKRKQELTNKLLWKDINTAEISASVVIDILSINDGDEWVKKQDFVREGAYSMIKVVRALMMLSK